MPNDHHEAEPPRPQKAMPNNIRALRQQRQWSQLELAERLGISRSKLSRYETRVQRVPVEMGIRLSRVLQCRFTELFTGAMQYLVLLVWGVSGLGALL
jgi:transcriptional regulator with XRE-family HTH domain